MEANKLRESYQSYSTILNIAELQMLQIGKSQDTIIILSINYFLAVLLRKYCSTSVSQFKYCIREFMQLFKVSLTVIPYVEIS